MLKNRCKDLQSSTVLGRRFLFHFSPPEGRIGRGTPSTHGLYKSGLARIYHGMMDRCFNPKSIGFKNWGGRGITVEPWLQNPVNFKTYIDYVLGPRPKGFVLDRIDNEKGYERNNLRWTSRQISASNRRDSYQFRTLTFDGKTKSLLDWSKEVGLSCGAICSRLKAGWSIEKALKTSKWKARLITHDGRTMSVRAWAAELSITPHCLRSRLKKYPVEIALSNQKHRGIYFLKQQTGWFPKQRRTGKVRDCKRRRFTYRGKTKTLALLAKESGIARGVLYSRIVVLGWSIKKALTTSVRVHLPYTARKTKASH